MENKSYKLAVELFLTKDNKDLSIRGALTCIIALIGITIATIKYKIKGLFIK